jgi:3-methyladenine DNA glycosylase AlkD
MPAAKTKIPSPTYKNILSAVKKLSAEEKQLLRMQLFGADAIAEMKAFERLLRKEKKPVKKDDEEITNLTTSIRRKK